MANSMWCVYKTTNIKSNKYYIGKSSVSRIKNGYRGSGVYIRNCIRSGADLETKILATFDTESSAYTFEKLLTFIYWNDDLLMNMVMGGNIGSRRAGYTISEKGRRNISKSKIGENNPMYGVPSPNKGMKMPKKTKDKISKSRKGQHAGQKHHNSKLNRSDVIEIKKYFNNVGYDRSYLAEKYNVSKCTISDIYYKRSWSHI